VPTHEGGRAPRKDEEEGEAAGNVEEPETFNYLGTNARDSADEVEQSCLAPHPPAELLFLPGICLRNLSQVISAAPEMTLQATEGKGRRCPITHTPYLPKLYPVHTSMPEVLLRSFLASSSENRPSLLKNDLSSSLRKITLSNLEK
jgi:hypothetical protein